MRYEHDFSKGFPLSNCLLYYLGWYHKSGDIWADLRKCLDADGYFGSGMTKLDIVQLLFYMVDDWNYYAADKGFKLISVSKFLLPDWRVESWRRKDSNDPKLLAIAWEVLATFAFDINRMQAPIKKPFFSKKNPLKPRDYKNGRTYTEANRRANKCSYWAS